MLEARLVQIPPGPRRKVRAKSARDLIDSRRQACGQDGRAFRGAGGVQIGADRGLVAPADQGASRRRRGGLHRGLTQMLEQPDLVQGGGRAVGLGSPVPALQQGDGLGQPRLGVCNIVQQRNEVGARQIGRVGLQGHGVSQGHRDVALENLGDAVHPRRVRPLVADDPVGRIVARQIELVGARQPALLRIVAAGQVGGVHEASPLIAAVAGHGHQAVPALAHRHAARRDPADIAVRVGIDLIFAGGPEPSHGGGELVPVLRGHIVGRAEIGRGPRVAPDAAHRIGAAGLQVFEDHGTVPGELQLRRARGLACDFDGFVDHLHGRPALAIAVAVGIGGVGLIDIEVFLVGREDGQAKSDGPVVADGDPRQGRLAGPDGRKARRFHVHDIAQGRHAVRPVRVVGQDRPTGGGARRRDRPVVGADRVGGDILGERHHLTGLEGHPLGRQPVVAQDLGRNRAGIEAVGDAQPMVRLQPAIEGVGFETRRAGDAGALHLGGGVAVQAVAADAHHIFRRPEIWGGPGDLELFGQGAGAALDLADEGVDAGGEGLGIALGRRPIGGPFGVHVAPIEEQARGPVLGGEVRAEVLGQQAQAALAPQVDLPEPVAGDIVALQEKSVPDAGRVDVRDAPAVHENLGRRLKPRHLMVAAGGLGGGLHGQAGQRQTQQAAPCASSQVPSHGRCSRIVLLPVS